MSYTENEVSMGDSVSTEITLSELHTIQSNTQTPLRHQQLPWVLYLNNIMTSLPFTSIQENETAGNILPKSPSLLKEEIGIIHLLTFFDDVWSSRAGIWCMCINSMIQQVTAAHIRHSNSYYKIIYISWFNYHNLLQFQLRNHFFKE